MSQSRTLWEDGREPGRQVVVLGLAVSLSVVMLDLMLSERLTLFFDLSFVALCLGLALAVRPGDFLVVGLLPPLLMIAVFALLAVTHPTAIARTGDSVVQAVISGLAAHSGALLAGYAVCLGVLAYRQRVLTRITPRSGTGRPHHA